MSAKATIFALLGMSLLGNMKGSGNSNISKQDKFSIVAEKLAKVVSITYRNKELSPELNLGKIKEYLYSIQDHKDFDNLLDNLMYCQIDPNNSIFYFQMTYANFKLVMRKYLKRISIWFSSPRANLKPINKNKLKKSWLSRASGKSGNKYNKIQKLSHKYYALGFLNISHTFRVLPFIENSPNNPDYILSNLMMRDWITMWIPDLKDRCFHIPSWMDVGTFDHYKVINPFASDHIYEWNNIDTGFADLNYDGTDAYPRDANIFDTAMETSIPRSLYKKSSQKEKQDFEKKQRTLGLDFSWAENILPKYMSPFDLHYVFFHALQLNPGKLYLKIKSKPTRLWES
jgi:hypothetical protein